MLKYRLLTALILLPLIFLAVFDLPNIYFFALMAVVTGMGAWEWSGLIGFESVLLRLIFVITIFLGMWLSFQVDAKTLIVTSLLFWLWMCVAVLRFSEGKLPLGFELPSIRLLGGVVFCVGGFLAFCLIHVHAHQGPAWLLLMLIVIMAADTGAYFVGKSVGKTHLCPRVSPNKTWAGFWGGLIVGLLVSVVGSFYFDISFSRRISFWVLSLVAIFFSVIGDLSVSMLKRQLNRKDTGSLLPGHGGMLDRMDSLYAGMVIFALGFLWL